MMFNRSIHQAARRLAAVLALGALLAGCQHMPEQLAGLPLVQSPAADAKTITGELPPPAERVDWPPPEPDVNSMRAQGYGLVNLPEMQRYLNGLLARIKQEAGVPQWPGEVHILASPQLDALATGAGNIYVSQALLNSMESEDEVVALLTHEFAHVYLHYHRLAEAVPRFDTAAKLLSVGAHLALQTGASAEWSKVDTAIAAYSVTRELASTAWARSQESAADLMGLNLSLRMGYSYDYGYKALLERLATWEEQQEEHREAVGQALTEAIREQAAAHIRARTAQSSVGNALSEPLGQVAGMLGVGLEQVSQGLGNLWGGATSSHPDILNRLERLSLAIDRLPPETLEYEPTRQPWQKALQQRRTATTLKHYALAAQALENLDDPKALNWAQQAAKGVTANHALPLHAVFQARLARANSTSAKVKASDILNRNIQSSPDRAWAAYLDRSQALAEANRRSDAHRVLMQGFQLFNDAAQVWPPVIAAVGRNESWEKAQQLADQCRQRFPLDANACNQAALSPTEERKQQKSMESRVDSLVGRLFKR